MKKPLRRRRLQNFSAKKINILFELCNYKKKRERFQK